MKIHLILKARTGLVQRKQSVTRAGKTYQTTVWVRADQKKKGEKSSAGQTFNSQQNFFIKDGVKELRKQINEHDLMSQSEIKELVSDYYMDDDEPDRKVIKEVKRKLLKEFKGSVKDKPRVKQDMHNSEKPYSGDPAKAPKLDVETFDKQFKQLSADDNEAMDLVAGQIHNLNDKQLRYIAKQFWDSEEHGKMPTNAKELKRTLFEDIEITATSLYDVKDIQKLVRKAMGK